MAMAKHLGVTNAVASRVYKATEAKEPIAVAHLMPGPEPLRRLLKSASRKGVPPEYIREAAEAVDQFDRLIREVAGDRGGLDIIIGSRLRDVRERADFISRQTVYKGMSHIRGESTETFAHTHIIHPGKGDRLYDHAILSNVLGFHRLRPTQEHSAKSDENEQDLSEIRSLDGGPIHDHNDLLLPEFSSKPLPEVSINRRERFYTIQSMSPEIGLNAAVDLAWCYVVRSTPFHGVMSMTRSPTKKSVLNVLVHRDIPVIHEPILRVYDTAGIGPVRFGDHRYTDAILDHHTRLEHFGSDTSQCGSTDIPRFAEMVRMVCFKLGWDVSAFRGYRCSIEYPMYGAQICMAFDPGEADNQGPTAQGIPLSPSIP